ncbi:hypothetical protein M2F98_19485 [Vibrio vulnificus]|nr:hypothetical protein [Vibrio vulnificus]
MEFITIDNIAKIIALATSVFVVFSKFNEFTFNKKVKLRSDYDFAEKLIAGDKWKDMSDFLLEKGYLAISGKALNASEIRFILNTQNPLSKFELFEQAQLYLTLSIDDKNKKALVFKNHYKSTRIKKVKIYNSLGYFVTAFLASTPVFFIGDIINTFGFNGLWGAVVFSLPLGSLAYIYVREYWNICAAERIVNEVWKELS